MESRVEHAMRVMQELEGEEDGLKKFRQTVRKILKKKSPLDYMAPIRLAGRPRKTEERAR